ncbi:MAG: FkbM family methyltransferase [Verrucomicrobiales bacterium]|nr:MAG: FkbM family methyltransferase [Verrucomicrobiales bacterium]
MINLYALYRHVGFPPPRNVCEIGGNSPDKCSLISFIEDQVPAILVEPLPWLAEQLRKAYPQAWVIEGVIGNVNGTVKLFDRGEGSWIDGVPSGAAPDEHPNHSAMKREEFAPQFVREVQSYTIDAIDTGIIDILCVDIEGAEWYVIEKLVSRPFMVRVETHFSHSGYRNPFYDEIFNHMKNLGYSMIVQDVSDTLWMRRNLCT